MDGLTGHTPSATAPTPASAAPARTPARRDIQGLRALAVLLVVLDHAWRLPRGGFVGVDVFFVISGFLITGLILRDVSRTGWLSVGRFYARRVRRIVPAATLVAVVTVVAGYLVWYAPRAHQNALDGLASVLWVSNWHFAATGTDYLEGSASPPAMQHYWSLSVEEQFYVVWPWVVLLGVIAARRHRRLLGAVLVIAAGVSFAWSMLGTALLPRLSYFDTIGRAWEFALGALVVLAATPRTRALRTVMLGSGVLLIIGGAFFISPALPFPGPWALVPVAGAALIIWSGPSGTVLDRVLDNPVAQWLGDRSYSLYLWHFPALILGRAVLGDGALTTLALVALALLLTELSYRFVEEPARHSGWLRGWESPATRRRSVLTGAVIACAIAVLAASQFNPSRWMVLERTTFPSERAAATVPLAVDDVAGPVRAGLDRTNLSYLVPSADDLGTAQLSAAFDADGCENTVDTVQMRVCTWGHGETDVMVIGDSVAMAWWPAITSALSPDAHSVHLIPVSSCAPFDVRHGADWGDPDFADDCAAARTRVEARVRATSPDLLIASSAVGGYRLVDGPARPAWEAGTRSAVERWRGLADDVVVLSHPPLGADPRDCLNRISGPADCMSTIPDWESEAIAAEAQGTTQGGGRFVDTTSWFCIDRRCPLAVGDYIARADTTHLTHAMAQALASRLRGVLVEGWSAGG